MKLKKKFKSSAFNFPSKSARTFRTIVNSTKHFFLCSKMKGITKTGKNDKADIERVLYASCSISNWNDKISTGAPKIVLS